VSRYSAAIGARGQGRIAQIKKPTSDYDREKPQEHLVKLAGGVAVIVNDRNPPRGRHTGVIGGSLGGLFAGLLLRFERARSLPPERRAL
jgi:hypothetical protein